MRLRRENSQGASHCESSGSLLCVVAHGHDMISSKSLQHLLGTGLRALQGWRALEALVKRVKATRDALPWGPAGPPPLLVKIAPDLSDRDKADIAAVAQKLSVDGLVVANTTLTRPPAVADHPSSDQVQQGPEMQINIGLTMRRNSLPACLHAFRAS